MGKSRGRHVAPRSASRKALGFAAGGAGILLLGGVLVSGAVAAASSQSAAPSPAATAAAKTAATSIFDLKGFANGPEKVVPTAPSQPKTVLDPDAVADPYSIPVQQAPAAPAPTPSSTGTPSG